jgi:polyisoprenoid-binding protein YceI
MPAGQVNSRSSSPVHAVRVNWTARCRECFPLPKEGSDERVILPLHGGSARRSVGCSAGRRRPIEEQGVRDLEADERANRGRVQEFAAQIKFDPVKAAQGSAQVSIDIASVDLGDKMYNDQVAGKDWFDAKTYPQATFMSAIAPAGGNKYNVTGKLTIKGKAETVTVPVTITQSGATQTFDGVLPIKRSVFDVGTGEWKDTSVVADDVQIKFHIVATK